MLFNEIDNFIEVYYNSVIELVLCFGTSFSGRIEFRPKARSQNCIRSITYNYCNVFLNNDDIIDIKFVILLINTSVCIFGRYIYYFDSGLA